MKQNMGNTDKFIRLTVTAIIASLSITGVITGMLSLVLTAVALIFTATSIIGICPLYLPFKFSTKTHMRHNPRH